MGIWTKKPIDELASHTLPSSHSLKKALNAYDLILLGIGAVIGAGLFSITGIAAAENAGPAITLAFLIAACGCAFAALCYCELASMMPISGSAYTYAYATMGELIGWLTGWNLLLEYAIGAAAVAVSWSAYLFSLSQDLNIDLPAALMASPWQPITLLDGSTAYGFINLPAFLIVAALSFLLAFGIKQASIVNAVIVTIKVGLSLVFIILGFFYIRKENYSPFLPENSGEFGNFGLSGMMRAAATLFFAYVGFDTVSTAAQETKNPQKNVPIGILGALVISTILYVAFAAVLTGMVNYKELNVAAPVALALSKTPFFGLSSLMKAAILIGFSSVILVMLLGQSRIFFAMSRDGFLPVWFSSLHPKWRTPYHANFIIMLFVGTVAAFAPLSLLGHMTSIGTLLAFITVCIGVLVLRYSEPHRERPFKAPFFPYTPIVGVIICVLMMASLGQDNWLRLALWLLLGLVIYLSYSRYKIDYLQSK